MKRFAFRLDPVLGQRKRVENERAGEHARALADQLAAQQAHDALLDRRDVLRARLTAEHASFDVETLRTSYAHLDYLDRALAASQQRVNACIGATERARARLIAAAKDRKVLATLKERRRESFDRDAALAEQRELDDANARAYDRTHHAEGSTP